MQYNKERILSRLMEMIQIDSVSYKEGPMTDYLQKYFEDRGYEVYRDQAGKAVGGDHSGNLLIHIPGTMEGESICLNAHQDTVEPGIGIVPVLEDGKLKSSGDTILAADDKSGIAIMLELLEVLKETELFLQHVDSEGTVFRANHASNYLTLKGTLNGARKALLAQIAAALDGRRDLKPEFLRAL